jgi:RNA polymerase sigma factor (sigma-70 family)
VDKEKDIDLINKIKNNQCDESLREIINRHSALCFNIYNKYSKILKTTGELIDDISLEKDYIIYKSALSFDPTRKTKFSTWLGNFTKYYCLNLINSKKKYVPMEDEMLNAIREKETIREEKDDNKEIQEFVTNLLDKMKDKRIQRVFKLRYAPDFAKRNTWVEIGKRMKVSPQTAMNLHDRGKKIIAKKLHSDNFADSL